MESRLRETQALRSSPITVRRKKFTWIVSLAVLLGVPGTALAQETRIMPLGDSITQGVNGQCSYRKPLSQTLSNTPGCRIEFVGPVSTAGGNPVACRPTNTNHAGRATRRADEVNAVTGPSGLPFITDLMNNHSPDVVLVHLGSNDLFQGQPLGDASVTETLVDIEELLDNIFATNPSAQVMLANVVPWNGASTADPTVSSNPLKDRFVQLGAGIATIATTRDRVTLVEVQNGFDPAEFSYDRVHPNDDGEAFIADRFARALIADGLCDEPPVLPPLTLRNDRWAQIGLPADPGSASTVGDIFDELPASDYSQSWIVFRFLSIANRYERLDWNSEMQQGEAYWIVQRTGQDVIVNLPATSIPAPLTPSSPCPSDDGCFEIPLVESDQQTTRTWNMVAFPFAGSLAASATRFATPGGDCVNGCTQAEATSAGSINSPMFHFTGADNGEPYSRISGDVALNPWEGYWVAVPRSAAGNSPRWLLPAR